MKNLLSDRIQEIIDAGFSQADLCRAAGLTKGTGPQWLNGGIKSIKIESALGIQRLTGFDAMWLVTGKGEKKAPLRPQGEIQTGFDLQRQEAFPAQVQEVIDLMMKTDDRGKLKIKLAAMDAYELHNSHISRTGGTVQLTDEETKLIESLRQATKMGKSVIKAAVNSAEKESSLTKTKKVG